MAAAAVMAIKNNRRKDSEVRVLQPHATRARTRVAMLGGPPPPPPLWCRGVRALRSCLNACVGPACRVCVSVTYTIRIQYGGGGTPCGWFRTRSFTRPQSGLHKCPPAYERRTVVSTNGT